MEGALVLIVILLIAVVVAPIVIAANSSSKINRIYDELRAIKDYLRTLKKDIDTLHATPPTAPPADAPATTITTPPAPATQWARPPEPPLVIPQEVLPETPTTPPQTEIDATPDVTPEPATEAAVTEQPHTPIEEETIEDHETVEEPAFEEEPIFEEAETVYFGNAATARPERVSPQQVPPRAPRPPAKKTDFEQFIGEKLVSIVGIAILVLGIFFSVKWAIDRNLISDAGKVMIGLVAGTILVAVAHRLAKNYRAFSSILAGGGIAVFYFSIYEAYQSYHLVSQTAAFLIMIVITILAVILSLIYDKKELAVIAIVGGFCTPFFVSNGSGNYQVLFSYLLILNIGMFALAYFKKWNLVNVICYCFTMILFSGWAFGSFDPLKQQAAGGMLFISLFFLIFFGMNIIYNLRHRRNFGYGEISMLLSNSFIYLGFGLYFLSFIQDGKFQGMFTLGLAIFNFIFAYAFYRKQQVDKNLVYLLIGLVLTFLSLTGPLQLDGNYITLFWASELVILYWMGQRTGIDLLKNASIVVLFCALVSLGMDWEQGYYTAHINNLPLIFNKVFITALVMIASIAVTGRLIKNDTDGTLLWGNLPVLQYRRFISLLLIAAVYMSGLLEVLYQSFALTRNGHFQMLLMWEYHYLLLAVLSFIYTREGQHPQRNVLMIVIAGLLLCYPIANYAAIELREDDPGGSLHYWHYLLPVLALVCVIRLVGMVRAKYHVGHARFNLAAWGITAATLFIISAEAIHIWVEAGYQPGFDLYDMVDKARKVALPIIWSVASLLLMLSGMRRKLKIFRIISLSLFSLTIAKLFLYDISNVGQGGKIAAFIILGVILLVVSFMYQKIKGLFTGDEQERQEP